MPTPRAWLPRIHEILGVLRNSKIKEFDRTAIEHLFELQRRAALTLIEQAGATKSGGRHIVTRKNLISWVESIESTEGQELERRKRLARQLQDDVSLYKAARREAGLKNVSFTLPKEFISTTFASLPDGIEISAGRICVSFQPGDPESACQLLYLLGIALTNDFDSFLATQHASLHASQHAS